jgi:hypothetical protein
MPLSSNHAKRQLWIKRFHKFQKSKLSVAQFCQSAGCSIPSFYQWRRKIASPSVDGLTRQSSPFLQLETTSSPAIRLELPSGVVIVIPVEAIDALPRVLEQVA